MAFKIIFLEEFGEAFVPKKVYPHLRSYLMKAGISEVPYRFFGGLFYLTALITGLVYIIYVYPFLAQYSQFLLFVSSVVVWFIIQISMATLMILVVYFYLDMRIYRRTREMEQMLPDFLQVLSSNLKGGMSVENSLWAAIKPRFSVLANEMSEASKKVMTGYDVGDALSELGNKYNSPMLRRSLDLIISEIESGGNIADLIDRIVDNFKETSNLKEEISASSVAYIIFIAAIVIVIAPLLFALSFHLLTVTLGFVSKLSSVTVRAGVLPFSFSEITVQPNLFKNFSIVALVVISFFSSLIVSIVEKGNIKGGIKYIPIFLIGSLAIYLLLMKILGGVFVNITV